MMHSFFTFLILWLVTICSCQGQGLSRGALVDIVIPPDAATSEKIAAVELSHYLGQIQPLKSSFIIGFLLSCTPIAA